jgi:hypothetical protein
VEATGIKAEMLRTHRQCDKNPMAQDKKLVEQYLALV